MRALIFNGQLVELAAADFPVHQSMQWVDAPLGATMDGYYWDGVAVSPKPAPPPPPIPSVVTMRQARLALLNAGLLTSVNNTIAGLPGASGDAARIEWEFAATVDRNSPLVANLSSVLSLTSMQLDALFTTAAGIT